ncbi:MAG: Ig-like domain-containing protein, partial [Trichodesmium sp. St4_bin8_1]|nr:Ig-like domain-containing protein [Trichodesmium sp. St4_bin8_1]
PIATDDNASSNVGQTVTFDIVNNDIDNDGNIDPSTIDLDPSTEEQEKTLTLPEQGTFTVDDEGNITFAPLDEFVGKVNIFYTVADKNGSTSNRANINVILTKELLAIDDNASTNLDKPVSFNVTDNDIAMDGNQINPATIDLDPKTTEPEKTLTVDEGDFIVDENGELTFTPTDGFVGEVTIFYSVKDVTGNITTSQGKITVEVIDNPPIATDDNASTTKGEPVTFDIVNNDIDNDGNIDPTTIDLDPSTEEQEKTKVVEGEGTYTVDDTGKVTFTPETDFAGTATPIPYTVADNNNQKSDEAKISVVVVNTPPIATDDNASTTKGEPVTFDIVNNDIDNDGNIDPTTIDLDPSTE